MNSDNCLHHLRAMKAIVQSAKVARLNPVENALQSWHPAGSAIGLITLCARNTKLEVLISQRSVTSRCFL